MQQNKILKAKKDKADQIRTFIYKNINSGDYSDRIPSLSQLAEHFNVNIKTAKRAVDKLEAAGIVVSHKGKGTFVNQNDREPAPILFIGRENKEISGAISSVLASAVDMLELNYSPYTFLLPRNLDNEPYELSGPKGMAGMLIEGKLLEHINADSLKVPLVKLHAFNKHDGFPAVRSDVEDGIKQAVDYLRSLGHKKISYLGPDSEIDDGLDSLKRKVFCEHIIKHKLKTKGSWNPHTYFRVEEGYKSAIKILKGKEKPTALVCVNDEVALGALNACDVLGLSVPGDVSVVGFDDRAPAIMRKPFLTTVKVDFKQTAVEGIKLLHKCVSSPKDNEMSNFEIVLPVHLIIRETTGRPKND